MEKQKKTTNHDRPARSKKSGRKGRILRFVLLGLLLLALAALLLVNTLLNRVTRPAEEAFAPVPTATPTAAPTPSPTPDAPPSAAPATSAPTPTPTPLPLSELYPQTPLSEAQYAQMEADNQDTERFRHILLVGVDRRGTSGNSSADAIMIATIDKANGRLKLSSILRDVLVEIPGQELYGKLNSAASHGGIPLLMETLNRNFRLNIREYVLVDFRMFIEIVDHMGGVTVHMSAGEISAANDCIAGLNKQWGVEYLWDGFIFAEAGNVQCTGKQALGYARIRHLDSDFKRTDRQHEVLRAVFAKFMSMNPAKQYALLYELLPMVETNMENEAIVECALSALGMHTSGLLQYQLPAENTWENGRYERKAVLLSDLTQNAWLLHDFLHRSAAEPTEAKLLTPGASLPPRTPRPVIAVPDAYGNVIYYYEDGTPVPGQNIVYPEGAAPQPLFSPTPTPWQSLGDGTGAVAGTDAAP